MPLHIFDNAQHECLIKSFKLGLSEIIFTIFGIAPKFNIKLRLTIVSDAIFPKIQINCSIKPSYFSFSKSTMIYRVLASIILAHWADVPEQRLAIIHADYVLICGCGWFLIRFKNN